MELKVINKEGQETGRSITLAEDIFGIEPNQQALYLDVKQYLANQRQGTHKSKERAEIARTTKKLKRQKGTGGARAGSMKSGLFVGGGRIFGPRPRDYSFKLNKKLKQLARISALASKAQTNKIVVIEDFVMDSPSTKAYTGVLTALNASNVRTLFVTPSSDKNLYLSSRNLQKAEVLEVEQLHTYAVLKADTIVLSEQALDKLTAFLNQQ